jgi:hypothetical protein
MDVTRYSNQRVRAAFVQLFKAAARALDLAGMISARTKTALVAARRRRRGVRPTETPPAAGSGFL